MKMRKVKEIIKSKRAIEGAGVLLNRLFAQGEVPKFDPFLLLDDFGSHDVNDYIKGFPWHPHRGIETITYMKSGEVEHQDSLGNKGVIKEGDVQWMTAGSGIIHQEMPQVAKDSLRGFQLWVNLPKNKKLTQPTYRGIQKNEIPKVAKDDVSVSIISGEFENTVGSAHNLNVDVRYFDVEVAKSGTFAYSLPLHFTAFVYVYEGSIEIGESDVVESGCVALTSEGDSLKITGKDEKAQFIMVAGEPIGESVAWGGPIVMNSDAEVRQAFFEYQNGTFIK